MNEFNENYDDDEYGYQVFKEDMEKNSKHWQRWQAEQSQKYNNQVLNQLWNESLSEEGLDPNTYGSLAGQHLEHTKQEIKKSMKQLITGVKKGPARDPKTGQFVSQTQSNQIQQPQLAPQHREMDTGQSRIEALKETAKKRPLSHEEELDVLDAILGPGLL